MNDDVLTHKIIGAAYKVHNQLGAGFLEKVYENALRLELNKQGLAVEQQVPIAVYYENEIVGDYYADLWVEKRIIVEIKAIRTLAKEHEVQLVNYLNAVGLDIGLLLNFGPSVQVKRKYRHFQPKTSKNNPDNLVNSV
ncbi:MAG: GxxExxY protein [Anaerolineae bacterium]|nr:GxxExxY protein [Anaerolineae bacterium]